MQEMLESFYALPGYAKMAFGFAFFFIFRYLVSNCKN
jgi:hypothetical protein